MTFFQTTWWKKGLVSVFLLTLVLGPIATWNPKIVNAQQAVAVVADGTPQSWGTWLEGKVTSLGTTIGAIKISGIAIKEYTLDGIAFMLAKRVLKSMTQSTLSWINSGFQGSPMYVTDPGAFLQNIADEAAGEVLYGSDLKFLCSPINVRIALSLGYKASSRRQPVMCTISGAVGNVESFARGNFMSGGWPAWLSVSLNPSNSTIGSGLVGQAAIYTNIRDRQSGQQQRWSWGKGFLDKEVCTGGPPSAQPKKCETVTPGDTIAQSLTFKIQGADRALIEADEINEIIGALFAQMLQKGLAGLFSLTQPGSGNSYEAGAGGAINPCNQLSYLDQLNTPSCNPLSESQTVAYTGDGSISGAVNDELSYQAMHERVVTATNSIINEAESRGFGCSINDSVIDAALATQRTASSSIAGSQALTRELMTLLERSEKGTEEEKFAAFASYTQIMGSGSLHSAITNVRELDAVENRLKEVEKLRVDIRDCPRTVDPDITPAVENGGG